MFNWVFCFMLVISGILWIIFIPSHRTPGVGNKINVGKTLGRLAGSRNEWVDWRSFSFQLGFASHPLWYIVFVKAEIRNIALVFPAVGVTVAVIQFVVKSLNRDKSLT